MTEVFVLYLWDKQRAQTQELLSICADVILYSYIDYFITQLLVCMAE